MCSVDFDYQILKLTSQFYNDYPNPPHLEILSKVNRAYNCLLIKAYPDVFMCIPYRTNVSHKYAYHFKNSIRSKNNRSGLDYTKMVIISNTEYLDTYDAIIDKDEYNETVVNISQIKKEAVSFLDDYIAHVKGERLLHKSEFKRRYQYSPLKYFHQELKL